MFQLFNHPLCVFNSLTNDISLLKVRTIFPRLMVHLFINFFNVFFKTVELC